MNDMIPTTVRLRRATRCAFCDKALSPGDSARDFAVWGYGHTCSERCSAGLNMNHAEGDDGEPGYP